MTTRRQLARGRLLQDVAGGSGRDRLEDDARVLEDGQHDDRKLRGDLANPTRRLDAVDPRHLDVHEDEVPPERRRAPSRAPELREERLGRAERRRQRHVGRVLEEGLQALAIVGMIFHDDDACGHRNGPPRGD
jgi:hypothetical protein